MKARVVYLLIGIFLISGMFYSLLSPSVKRDLIDKISFYVEDCLFSIGLIEIKGVTEEDLAINRAHSCNMAIAAFIQASGSDEAEVQWNAANSPQDRYTLIRPFLSFSPNLFIDYQVQFGLVILLPEDLYPLDKVLLYDRSGKQVVYD